MPRGSARTACRPDRAWPWRCRHGPRRKRAATVRRRRPDRLRQLIPGSPDHRRGGNIARGRDRQAEMPLSAIARTSVLKPSTNCAAPRRNLRGCRRSRRVAGDDVGRAATLYDRLLPRPRPWCRAPSAPSPGSLRRHRRARRAQQHRHGAGVSRFTEEFDVEILCPAIELTTPAAGCDIPARACSIWTST